MINKNRYKKLYKFLYSLLILVNFALHIAFMGGALSSFLLGYFETGVVYLAFAIFTILLVVFSARDLENVIKENKNDK